MSAVDDHATVRRAAMRVGVLVGVASGAIIALGVGILILILTLTARPERHIGGGDRPGPDGDRIVVDLDHVLPWVIVLGLVGVVLLAVVAWLAARSAVRPLAAALALQRNFVADASHELRTPLTALTSRIQILQRRRERGESIDDTIASLRRDAATMDDVLTDMLVTTEAAADAGTVALVSDCLVAAVSALQPVADENDVRLVRNVDGNPTAAMPDVTLTRLCVALIDNAVQHAPVGSAVTVSATAGHGGGRAGGRGVVEIRVADHGAGIALGDTERIFERFARADEVGRRRGFGLGLALVRESTARFGGTVRVEHTSPAGTTFLMTLPSR